MDNPIIECSQCLFTNEHDPDLVVNEKGLCNHCIEYERKKQFISEHAIDSKHIQTIVKKIKESSKHKKYDCIIGVSGGVDSTYVALQVKELGLTPLAVHFDNGWNSELAIINIENIVKTLGFDLYTYVIDWDEFKDMQLAYLKASVVDIEAITDQAITAVMFQVARKFGIKFIISGENYRTEGTLPQSWVYIKSDDRNIRDIYKKFGTQKLKTYPIIGYFNRIVWQKILKFEYWRILDDIPYDKETAKKDIIEKLHWRDYGGKHYESIFTRFYQSYILPQKFNIDKRVSHYSTLICAGQLQKDEAKKLLAMEVYPANLLQDDKLYIQKKFKLSPIEFEAIMNQKPKSHLEYKNVFETIAILKKFRLHKLFKNLR
jgi:N-acetyl sugar amidotransferase